MAWSRPVTVRRAEAPDARLPVDCVDFALLPRAGFCQTRFRQRDPS